MIDLPIGTVITPNGLLSGLWALPRPLTRHWGSGNVFARICQIWGEPDVVFGKQDQVEGVSVTVDKDVTCNPSVVADWSSMPMFADRQFKLGYWDPPYLGEIGEDGDVHYKRMDPCLREICRVIGGRLFIYSPLVYPCPDGFHRIAVIATTMGPNKIVRALQGFERDQADVPPPAMDEKW